MGHVFISYSSRHRALTLDFTALLERDGFPVWWDRELEAWGEYESQIGIKRRLTAARSDAFARDPAKGVGSLGVVLSNLGWHQRALAVTEEAVAIHRHLAAGRPDAFEPYLAQTLGNLSEHFLPFDRQTDSIASAEEGITLLTPHHTRHPYAHQELMDRLNDTLAKARAGNGNGDAP